MYVPKKLFPSMIKNNDQNHRAEAEDPSFTFTVLRANGMKTSRGMKFKKFTQVLRTM
jgi:hypothetical protein